MHDVHIFVIPPGNIEKANQNIMMVRSSGEVGLHPNPSFQIITLLFCKYYKKKKNFIQ